MSAPLRHGVGRLRVSGKTPAATRLYNQVVLIFMG